MGGGSASTGQTEVAAPRRKPRRRADQPFVDLTDDEPTQVTSPNRAGPPSAAVTRAGDKKRKATATPPAAPQAKRKSAAVGDGEAAGPPRTVSLPGHRYDQPMPKTDRAATLPSSVERRAAISVKAAVTARPNVHEGLKMTLLEAVSILGPEALQRTATYEEGTPQRDSLHRLWLRFKQVSSCITLLVKQAG